MNGITRRALISAAPAIGLIAAAPTLARTEEAPPFDLQSWLNMVGPRERANYHLSQLTSALYDMNPGQWTASAAPDMEGSRVHDHVLIHRNLTPGAKPGVWVQFL